MTTQVANAIEQVKALLPEEHEEFLSWLAEYELQQFDDWDREIERDSQPGGRLESFLQRVRKDTAEGRTKPLDEVIDNS